MDKSNVSIATMTWARNATEEAQLRASLSRLAELRILTFITDGGSDESFIEFLRNFANFRVFLANAPGVWNQVRQSLQAASMVAAEFILYTEPDKSDFFQYCLEDFISAASGADRTGIVLASRSPEDFATFPEFQRYTESAINRCCAELLGLDSVDFSYGPFLLNCRLLPSLYHLTEEIGWGWRPFAFRMAHRLGYRIESLEKSAPCPHEQREDNRAERIYRIKQLSQSIQGLLLSANISGARSSSS